MNEIDLRGALSTLLEIVSVIAVDLYIIKKSLLSSHKDFEDAIQIFAAGAVNSLDFIVTRDLKHFKNAGVPVLSPDGLLSRIKL